MTSRLVEELQRTNAEFPLPSEGGSLWEYLHHGQQAFWSLDNFPLTPVLVFDQFEELLLRSVGDEQRMHQIFDDLGDLIEKSNSSAISGGGR